MDVTEGGTRPAPMMALPSRLYHIGAVSYGLNRERFCVEGRVSFAFTAPDDAHPTRVMTRVRLDPLELDASEAAAASIDVVFQGLWRVACAGIAMGDIIRVLNARVGKSDDVEVNAVQLTLADGFGGLIVMMQTGSSVRELVPLMAAQGERLEEGLVSLDPGLNGGGSRGGGLAGSDSAGGGSAGGGSAGGGGGGPALGGLKTGASSKSASTGGAPVNRGLAGSAPASEGLTGSQEMGGAGRATGIGTRGGGVMPGRRQAVRRGGVTGGRRVAGSGERVGSYYQYTPVAELWKRVEDNNFAKDEKFHVYGIVIDARAPCSTRGDGMRSEMVIADESSTSGTGAGDALKTITVYRFEKNPLDAIPFRSVGDVVRCHRLLLEKYDDPHTGQRFIQGKAKFYSTFLLWPFEQEGFQPLATKEPVRLPTDTGPHPNVTHTMTPLDQRRIKALKHWSRSFFSNAQISRRPFLRTVLDVVNAPPHADFITKSFDLICCFEGEPSIRTVTPGHINCIISDGLARNTPQERRLVVESEISQLHAEKASSYSFVDCSPSWGLRPRAVPLWLLIRDARVQFRNSGPVILLSVSKHTSTLIWHPAFSPEVRLIQAKYAASSNLVPPPASIQNASQLLQPLPTSGYGGTTLPEQAQRPQPPALPPPQQQQQPQSQQAGFSHTVRAAALQALVQAGRAASTSAPGAVALTLREPGVSTGLQTTSILDHTPASTAAQRAEDVSAAARRKALEERLAIPRPVITTNANDKVALCSISEMVLRMKHRKQVAFRLRVRVHSLIVPWDVRLACRPWCETCSEFLFVPSDSREFACATCKASFRGTGDANLKWAYMVSLCLEDEGGAHIQGFISGVEGSQFFKDVAPTNLMRNKVQYARVAEYLRVILEPDSRLDCSVKPYEFEDQYGVYHVACKIFGTSLLSDLLPARPEP